MEFVDCTRQPHPGCVTHGRSNTPEYRVWAGMVQRCTNPRCAKYERYGGRGITVCARWLLFANFIRDMGERPSPAHSIDRADNDGNYEPSNCRWATRSEQQKNKGEYPKNNRLPTGDAHWTRKDRVRAVSVARENIKKGREARLSGGHTKINASSAAEIRGFYKDHPDTTMAALGARFNICREYARKIVRGLSW